jgi:hypothetical protein
MCLLQESGHLDAVGSVQQQPSATASVTKPATGTISGMLADFSKALGKLTEKREFKTYGPMSLCIFENSF